MNERTNEAIYLDVILFNAAVIDPWLRFLVSTENPQSWKKAQTASNQVTFRVPLCREARRIKRDTRDSVCAQRGVAFPDMIAT